MTEQPHGAHGGGGGGGGGDAHDGHHSNKFIQHHYDDAKHQFESGKLGIWLFLAQEVLFFSALFVAYILYRYHHPEIYEYAHRYLDTKMGAINTAVLIFSSLTAAWAVRAAQLGQRKLLIACLGTTIVCAFAFLGVKYLEYSHKVHEHILFGRYFDPCVSSGGTPLLTKNNECPGSKSTVEWNKGTEKPEANSCFKDIDQDPRAEGVQADCEVEEVKGRMVAQADRSLKFVKASSKPITKRCVERYWGENEVDVSGERQSEQPSEGAKEGMGFPCWRPAVQPAVCKRDAGIIVEYGDEDERGEDTRIEAKCKPSPKVVEPKDPLADEVNMAPKAGQKSFTNKRPLTREELFDRETAGPPPEHTSMFFTIYFAMTGLHGIHVLVGIGIFTWLLIRAIRGDFTADYFGPVDFAALYWHIVDLIWIFLFPLLYLIH